MTLERHLAMPNLRFLFHEHSTDGLNFWVNWGKGQVESQAQDDQYPHAQEEVLCGLLFPFLDRQHLNVCGWADVQIFSIQHSLGSFKLFYLIHLFIMYVFTMP